MVAGYTQMVIKIDDVEALNRVVTKAGSAVRCGFKSHYPALPKGKSL